MLHGHCSFNYVNLTSACGSCTEHISLTFLLLQLLPQLSVLLVLVLVLLLIPAECEPLVCCCGWPLRGSCTQGSTHAAAAPAAAAATATATDAAACGSAVIAACYTPAGQPTRGQVNTDAHGSAAAGALTALQQWLASSCCLCLLFCRMIR